MYSTSIGPDIFRTTKKVFDYFTDISNDREWNPFAKEAKKTSEGPLGLGTTGDRPRR